MIIISIILCLYAAFLLWNGVGILRNNFKVIEKYEGSLTIIIPFHNEELNLPILFNSLVNLKGLTNQVEIIFINDHSTDSSVAVVNDLIHKSSVACHFRLMDGIKRGKKSSIQLAVESAQNQIILLSDSDVFLDADWIQSMCSDLKNADLVLGSVINSNNTYSILSWIQDTEALMLEGIKTGSANNKIAMLASGASIGFKKDKFINANPYADNLDLLSGDDMFLLAAAKLNKWKINSNSICPNETIGKSDLKSSIKQHRRWASKTPALNNLTLNILGILTVFAQLSFIIGLICVFVEYNSLLVLSLIIKFLVEFLFLFSRAIVFNRLKLLIFTPIMSICYPFYLLIVIIGVNKNKTNW